MGVAYFAVVAHLLPPSDIGFFAILSLIVSFIQIFGTLALSSVSVKYIAEYLARGERKKAVSVVTRVLQISVLTSAVFSAMLLLSAEWLSKMLVGTTDLTSLFQTVGLASFFVIIFIQVASFLQGLQRIREVAIMNTLFAATHYVVGIYLLNMGLGLSGVIYGWLLGTVAASLAGLILTAKFLGLVGKPHPVKPLVNFSYPIYIAGILGFVAGWIDQLFILPIMGPEYLGVYYVALRASVVPSLVSSSIAGALFPQLSELHAQRGLDGLRDSFYVSTRYVELFGFPVIVGLAVLAYPAVVLIGGVGYLGAVLPLVILSVASLFGTVGVAVGPILMTLERTRIVSVLTVVSIILTMGITYVGLVYFRWGIVGAAFARAVTSMVVMVLSLYILKGIFSLRLDKEALWKASVASAFMVLAIFFLEIIRQILTPGPHQFLAFRLHLLPLYVLVGAIAYFFSLVALKAIKKQDVELVRDYLPKELKWLAVWLGRFAVAE